MTSFQTHTEIQTVPADILRNRWDHVSKIRDHDSNALFDERAGIDAYNTSRL